MTTTYKNINTNADTLRSYLGGSKDGIEIDRALALAIADELDYLSNFRQEADFGPAHSDVVNMIDDEYMSEYSCPLPEGYGEE